MSEEKTKTAEEIIAAEKAAATELEAERAAEPAEDLITRANAAAMRIEEANKKHEELLINHQQMKAEEILSGTADAGNKEQTPDEKETEGAKAMLKGTGYENIFDEEKPSKT